MPCSEATAKRVFNATAATPGNPINWAWPAAQRGYYHTRYPQHSVAPTTGANPHSRAAMPKPAHTNMQSPRPQDLPGKRWQKKTSATHHMSILALSTALGFSIALGSAIPILCLPLWAMPLEMPELLQRQASHNTRHRQSTCKSKGAHPASVAPNGCHPCRLRSRGLTRRLTSTDLLVRALGALRVPLPVGLWLRTATPRLRTARLRLKDLAFNRGNPSHPLRPQTSATQAVPLARLASA